MLIREATSDDWPAIWRFFRAIVAAGETFAYDPQMDEGTARASWMVGPPGRTVVAVADDGAVIGSANMYANREGGGAHIASASFMVDPAHHGRGAGRALGEDALRWARGFRGMQFNAVVESNTGAVRLWKSLGFEIHRDDPGGVPAPDQGLYRPARDVPAAVVGPDLTTGEHAVVIAGGGPTGLMLAGELALAEIDVAVVERRASQDLPGSRAGGLQSRTIEVFDQRGIADRFLAQGQVAQVQSFAGCVLDISDFPTRHNYGLGLWQNHIERILAGWVGELPVTIHRGLEVTGFAQDETGVDVELADGQSLRAEYLIGCDGGRSLVRRTAGIDFPGWDPSTSSLIAEVEMAEEPELGIRRDDKGTHGIGKLDYEIRDGEVVYKDGGPVRVGLTEERVGAATEPTLRDLSEALIAVYGTDYGVHSPIWISRFTDMTRQAAAYRDRRVLLAGDAAHVHSPIGGQGLSIGVQDAVNLGWKLARVVEGTAPETLLNTYHAERHPVAARVLRNTMAEVALSRPDDRIKAVRDTISELLGMDAPRRRFAAMMSGLDIHYDLGEGHPLLGRRMPDLDLVTADGPLRVFTLLHDARPVVLNLGEPGGFDITPWAGRVQSIDAEYAGTWELPALGAVTAPTAVLIRPDGHVAWVGEGTQQGLADALTTWFGPPTPPS